jgi:hypothetical protein
MDLSHCVMRERVLRSVMQLREVIVAKDPAAAKNALRRYVGPLVLTPAVQDGRRVFRVSGSVNVIPDPDQDRSRMLLVARDGIGLWLAVDSS